MFDDLPPDLERLTTLRTWHLLWVQRIDAKITALRTREAEEERGRYRRPPRPKWIVELGIGSGKPPVQLHAGDCHMPSARRRPISRSEARDLLTGGLSTCTHCQPDIRLNVLDLSPQHPSRSNGRAHLPDILRYGRLAQIA
ncbi:DUF6233 domain-containing protein [Streptomyces sp. Tue6028]|uniref:DUF6233 domain-containing protein n=1 Tax=Streptomyces sp. Tue6028 TaxID=2036037 RepID=UPI003D733908